jgi:hypothetical protein
VYQASVRSTTAGTAKTVLAIVAILSLVLSALAVARPALATDGANQVPLQNTEAGAGSEDECKDVADGTKLFHFVLNNLTPDSTLTNFEATFDPSTSFTYEATVINSTVTHVDVTITGDADLTGAVATFDKDQPSGPSGAKLVLSHICDETQAPTPTLTLDKVTVGGDSEFAFELDDVALSDTLSGADAPVVLATTSGTFTIRELISSAQADAGWDLTSIDCTGNATSETARLAGATVDVTVGADEDVVCTFTNTLTPPPPPSGEGFLEVDKLICLAETSSTDFDVTNVGIQTLNTEEENGGVLEDVGDCILGANVTFSVYVDANGNGELDEGEVLADDDDLVNGTLTTNENGAITIDLAEGDYILVEEAGGIEQGDWPGGSVAFSIVDGELTLIEVTNNIAEESGLLKIRKFFCDIAAPDGFNNPHFIELEGPEADSDASLPDQFAEHCTRGGENPEATFEIDGTEFTTTDGILVVSLPAGEHTVVETDPNMGETTVTVEVDATTSLLVLNFEEGGQQPDTGEIMIMKHVCPAGLTPAEFDQIATFGEKVFTCPVITLPGDEAAEGARDARDLPDSPFPDGTGAFDFSVVAGTTSLTLADDGTFMPAPTTCPDSGACVEVSHYAFGSVPLGEVTVTETDPPAGYDFGRVLFTPDSGDEATFVSAENGVIVLDTSNDDSVMLHVYNFAPAQEEQTGSITVQKEIQCEVCETFTPGFYFNQGENNEGSAFAEDSLSNDPITVAGMTFDSVQSVQDNADPGSLLRHYLALTLNVRMGGGDCDLLSLVYDGSVESLQGETVGTIWTEAGKVLNGESSEFSAEDLHDAIDEINNNHGAEDGVLSCDTAGLAGFEFALTDEEDNEVTGTTGDDGTVVFDDLPLGTYTLEEVGGPDESDCTVVDASGDGVEFDAETGVITITISEETADVTVTVVNDCGGQSGEQLGSITILKNAVPDDAQDFAFTTMGTGLTGFSLDDDADATLSNQKVFTSLAAGSYSVTESATDGRDLTSITCSAGGAADLATGTANITLAEGADVTCTFVNTKEGQQAEAGSITILKNAVPDDAQDFAFTTTGTGLSNFSLDDDADATLSNQKTFTGLSAGMYTVAESAVTGWTLTSLTCSPSASVTVSGAMASINLAAGANVTCTFVNTKQGSGTLPNQGGPTTTPRQGTLAGNLPNTATAPFDGTSMPVALVTLLMLSGLGAAAYAMKSEAARRR